MNFKKTKKLVEKINRLHTGMMEDGDDINPIERDLMLNYLRSLYDLFYEPGAIIKKTVEVQVAPPAQEAPIVPPVQEVQQPVYTAPTPPPAPKPEPIQLQKEVEQINREIEEVTISPPVAEIPTPTPPPATPPPPVEEKKPKKFEFVIPSRSNPNKSYTSNVSSESPESLFNDDSNGELSDKLSSSPIRDLNKAFGLNDKLMYANQLFDGQNHIFKETIEVLNSCNSFEQAKIYLIENVARTYNWNSSDKKKQAKSFIKTIKRRYT